MASMLNATLETPKNMQHIGAIGAMAIAGVGASLFSGFDFVDKVIKTEKSTTPNLEDRKIYLKILPTYKKAYEATMSLYDDLYA